MGSDHFDIDYRAYSWKNMDEDCVVLFMVARKRCDSGLRREYDLTERFLGLDGTDESTARYWSSQCASVVVIKHGKSGSTAYTGDGKSYSIRPFPVEALKGFGGGDGYASSFLYGLFQGYEIMDCLELGFCVCLHAGCISWLQCRHACAFGSSGVHPQGKGTIWRYGCESRVTNMEKKMIGKSGLEASALSLGCWAIGGMVGKQ